MTTDFRALCAELVTELECWRPLQEVPDCLERARAALACWGRPAPQPISVSERLPEAGEMTEDGEVWIEEPGHNYPLADTGDYNWEPHKWILSPISRFDAKNRLRWLPAHALPAPEANDLP